MLSIEVLQNNRLVVDFFRGLPATSCFRSSSSAVHASHSIFPERICAKGLGNHGDTLTEVKQEWLTSLIGVALFRAASVGYKALTWPDKCHVHRDPQAFWPLRGSRPELASKAHRAGHCG
jgi:hypothetical protein